MDHIDVEGIHALSPMQHGMLFQALHAPGSGDYVEQLTCELAGEVDREALRRAWAETIDRHAALRTAFVWERLDRPRQVVHRRVALSIQELDLSSLASAEQKERFGQLLADERRLGFDLARAPLMRLHLVRLAARHFRLAWTYHHLLLDGWSLARVLAEVFTRYEALAAGTEPPAAPPERPFSEFIAWLERRDARADQDFWREQLRDLGSRTPLGPPFVETLEHDGAAYREERVTLPWPVARALRAVARDRGLTLGLVLQAAWALVLGRHSGHRDVVFGLTVSGRPTDLPEVEDMVGLFINTIPIRIAIDPGAEVGAWLGAVAERASAWRDHEHVPLYELQRLAGAEGALFDSVLVIENYPVASLARRAGDVTVAGIETHEQTHYPLTVLAVPDELLSLGVAYDVRRFEPGAPRRLLEAFAATLQALASDPSCRVGELGISPDHPVVAWHGADCPLPAVRGFDEIFAAAVRAAPSAPALSWEEGEVSYAELDARAGAIAHALVERGLGRESRVGICLPRSPDMIAAVLGAWRAGAAYLPLDPDALSERTAAMLDDAGAAVVLTDAATGPAFGARALCVESCPERSEPLAVADRDLGDPAYVIYTSGSTGAPKGVVITQGALTSFVVGMIDVLGVGPCSRFLQFASLGFDASVIQIFPTLAAGGTLVLRRDVARLSPLELEQLCHEERLTILDLPAPLLRPFIEELERCGRRLPDSMALLMTGGDSTSRSTAVSVAGCLPPGARFLSSYGPTETTVTALVQVEPAEGLRSLATRRVPLGRPVPGACVYVVDDEMRCVPAGSVGEIVIGGAGLARGYLGRPALTAERFVPDPFASQPGRRLYRTGDLARLDAGGEIEFLGRRDDQVKVRGHRIELGEIDAALRAHPGVADSVTVTADGALVSYLVFHGQAASPAEVRAFARERLPAYMVPSLVVPVPKMPRLTSGKIDRQALPAPRPEAAVDGERPTTPVEQALAEVWEQLLGARPGRGDSFFDLGGHSLLATQLVAHVAELFGVQLPIPVVFERPTLAELARVVDSELAGGGAAAGLIERRIEPGGQDRAGGAPLSVAQERLWLLDQIEPGTSLYNLPVAMELDGQLVVPALVQALAEVVRRHAALRTRFVAVDGRPLAVADRSLAPLPVVDLTALPARAADAAAAEAERPFDLAAGPLLRARLLREGQTRHQLLATMHHVVADGWSMGILLREVCALYASYVAGTASPLAEPEIDYADFARWQRARVEAGAAADEVTWWKTQLAGAPQRLALPTRRRGASAARTGARLRTELAGDALASLRRLCRSERVTLFMALLAGLDVVLSRWSGQRDILIGSPVAGRSSPQTHGLIGCFLNTVVFRTQVEPSMSFRQLLARVRENAVAAYRRQETPFELVLDAIGPERDLATTPIFQVLLNVMDFAPARVEAPGLRMTGIDAALPSARLDLAFYAEDRDGRLQLDLVHDRSVIDDEDARGLLAHLERALVEGSADPDLRVGRIPLPVDPAPARVAAPAPAEYRPFPRAQVEQSLVQRFRRVADASPDRMAVVSQRHRWTYAELRRRANAIAHVLLAAVGPGGGRVALLDDHDAPMLAAMLGALGAGKAYVPLDPLYPPARLEFMVRDADVAAILAAPAHRALAEDLAAGAAAVVELDALDLRSGDRDPEPAIAPGDLAYLLYTSGSTGRPKGVGQSHRNVLHHARAYTEGLRIGSSDRLGLVASCCFDAAVMDIYGALLNGAAVSPIRVRELGVQHLAEAMDRLTIYHSTPTLFRHLLRSVPADRVFSTVRAVVLGGEEAVAADVELFRRHFAADCVLVNGFGPTESTLALQHHVTGDTALSRTTLPMGVPVLDTEVLLLDETGEPLAGAGVGEIAISSQHVALGYFRRPELTERAFSPDPVDPARRIYRTGDLARLLPDGRFHFVGRRDLQAKVRGFRVEPAEIEAVIGEHPAVRAAVVVVRPGPDTEPALVAYVVTASAGADARALRAHVAGRLPDHMVPVRFELLAELPLTPSGKIDRAALPDPAWDPPRSASPGGGDDPLERIIAGVWQAVLGLSRVERDDNFFERGGHSLHATQVVSRLRAALGVHLTLRLLFERPTVAELASAIRALRGESPPPALVRAPAGSAALSSAQKALWIVDRFDPGNPAHVVPAAARLDGDLRPAALAGAVTEVVRRHEVLRTGFADRSGVPVPVVTPAAPVPMPVADLGGLPPSRRDAELEVLALRHASRPFELGRPPLLRAHLARLDRASHAVLFAVHHIATDAWSSANLLGEVGALYTGFRAGVPSPLAELAVQYADHAHWQEERLRGPDHAAALAWWRATLHGWREPIALHANGRVRTSAAGARAELRVPATVARAIEALAARAGATPFMALLAAFKTLLMLRTGARDVLVGAASANRETHESEPLIGCFVNMLALRTDVDPDLRFGELLARVRDTTLGAFSHARVPFEQVVSEVQADRRGLFGVVFGVRNEPERRVELPELTVRPLDLDHRRSQFDLELWFHESDGELTGLWTYATDLFDAGTIRALGEQLVQLLSRIVEQPDARLSALALPTDAERSRLKTAEAARATARLQGARRRAVSMSEER